jgi:hypothetical protein
VIFSKNLISVETDAVALTGEDGETENVRL